MSDEKIGVDITPEDLTDASKKGDRIKTDKEVERENERLKAKAYENDQLIKKLSRQLEEALEPKRKPGITAVNEEGDQERRKRPNSWGLSDLIMPPYTKGRTAIYRVVGTDGINDATGFPIEPYDTLIPGRYILKDKFERDPLKRDKVMQNITGTERTVEDGKAITSEIVEDIVFQRGWIQVSVESQYGLYVFLELHPNNINNRHRPSNAPRLFERMDINTKSAASQGAAMELALDAANEIRKMNKEDVLSYAAATQEIATAKRPIHEVRWDLIRWAQNSPQQYYKLNKNAKATIQMNMIDAQNFGLIGYQMDKRGYVDLESDKLICNHTAAEDPMEKLVKFLGSGEGKEWYDKILDRMNYWS